MVNTAEALKSDDPQTIKSFMGSITSHITCDIKLIETELEKKQNGEFDIERISHQLIRLQKIRLSTHFNLIQDLNDRYIEVREAGVTEEAEKLLLKDDIAFIQQIADKV